MIRLRPSAFVFRLRRYGFGLRPSISAFGDTDGRTDGRRDAQTDGQDFSCPHGVLRTPFSSFLAVRMDCYEHLFEAF